MSRNGADIDHRAPRRGEQRQQGLGQRRGADDVNLELAPKRLRRQRFERALDNDPGHVDKARKPTRTGDARNVASRRLNGERIVEIELHGFHPAGSVRDPHTGRIARRRDHIAALARQAFDQRLADPGGRAGDDNPCWRGIGLHREPHSFAVSALRVNMKVPSVSGNSHS